MFNNIYSLPSYVQCKKCGKTSDYRTEAVNNLSSYIFLKCNFCGCIQTKYVQADGVIVDKK